MIYAVIDTNVLVSALWTKDDNAPTYRLARLLMDGGVKTLYNNDILQNTQRC